MISEEGKAKLKVGDVLYYACKSNVRLKHCKIESIHGDRLNFDASFCESSDENVFINKLDALKYFRKLHESELKYVQNIINSIAVQIEQLEQEDGK